MTDETLLTTGQPKADLDNGASGKGGTPGSEPKGDGSAKPAELNPDGTAKVSPDGKEVVKDGKSTPEGVPEKYEPFKVPEGIAISETMNAEISKVGKELKMSQTALQQLVDLHVKAIQQSSEESMAGFAKQKAEWAEASKKELGSDMTLKMAEAVKALNAVGDPELRQLLDDSGLGSHPAVIRMFLKIGKSIGEDKLADGRSSDGATLSAAEILYPSKK